MLRFAPQGGEWAKGLRVKHYHTNDGHMHLCSTEGWNAWSTLSICTQALASLGGVGRHSTAGALSCDLLSHRARLGIWPASKILALNLESNSFATHLQHAPIITLQYMLLTHLQLPAYGVASLQKV